MSATPSVRREYDVSARSTDVFGRVLCSTRDHHFVVDGPVQNGCPGEEVTPPELFLSAVASCGVELLHVIAREQGIPLARVGVRIRGTVDRGAQRHTDLTTFSAVRVDFAVYGAEDAHAAMLIEGFKRR